ncbi:MAG: tetratricopeptide repeat protein [Terriglobia bacterium]
MLLVDKAWELENEIKYQVGGSVKFIPKSQVVRIKAEKQPSAESRTPHYGFGVETSSPSTAPPQPLELTGPPKSSALSDDAVRKLQENLRANPNDQNSRIELVQVLNSMASIQASKGDLKAAKATLQSALGYNKKSPVTLWNLALLDYKTGEYRAAEDLLMALVEIDKRNQRFHYLLGEALYAQDKIPQAINEWEIALQFGPQEQISQRLAKAKQEAPTHKELGILQSSHFILRYDRQVSDYRLGQEMLTALEVIYRRLSSQLFGEEPGTVTVVIYPDSAYFDVTKAPRWSGAINDGKIRIPTKGLDTIDDQVKAVLTHEMVHSFVGFVNRGDCPTWFNEGVAQTQEGRSAGASHPWLKSLAGKNQLVPLTNLRGSFTQLSTESAQLAYVEGLSAVEYLVQLKGPGILKSIFSLMAQNYNFELAFRTATGNALTDFEKNWAEFLAR